MPAMPAEPPAGRPHMPDYGISTGDAGLLPWSWAEAQLSSSRSFWLATRWPDGRPHVMPVWAAWDGARLWFSAGLHARKTRNLLDDPRCTATTDDAQNPLVLDGVSEKVDDRVRKQAYLDLVNAKYDTDYQMDFLDPATTAVFGIRPTVAIGLREAAFSESPTRWRLDLP